MDPVQALSYNLTKDGVVFINLPEDIMATVKFYVGSEPGPFSILYWDAAAGKWEDLGGTLEDGYFSAQTGKTGIFVLVAK